MPILLDHKYVVDQPFIQYLFGYILQIINCIEYLFFNICLASVTKVFPPQMIEGVLDVEQLC